MRTTWINKDKTVSLFNMICISIAVWLVTMAVTIPLVKQDYMYKHIVRVEGKPYYLGITVPVNTDSTLLSMYPDSLYTRLYPSPLRTGTGKPFIIITEKEFPGVVFSKGKEK